MMIKRRPLAEGNRVLGEDGDAQAHRPAPGQAAQARMEKEES
jgi:hypothetical protein